MDMDDGKILADLGVEERAMDMEDGKEGMDMELARE
jgi:hypothetical protein